MNECTRFIHNCSVMANCENTYGSFLCHCNHGYTGNGMLCHDVDECEDASKHSCHANQQCTNYNGGFNCSCRHGFSPVPSNLSRMCVDDNECILGSHNCHSEAICLNNDGGFECRCVDGYLGNGTVCEGMHLYCLLVCLLFVCVWLCF